MQARIGHGYFSAEKFRDPASSRLLETPAFTLWSPVTKYFAARCRKILSAFDPASPVTKATGLRLSQSKKPQSSLRFLSLWTPADSNRSPPECKTGALPDELGALRN